MLAACPTCRTPVETDWTAFCPDCCTALIDPEPWVPLLRPTRSRESKLAS